MKNDQWLEEEAVELSEYYLDIQSYAKEKLLNEMEVLTGLLDVHVNTLSEGRGDYTYLFLTRMLKQTFDLVFDEYLGRLVK
jgi:hypothetical protein